ncbi:hypothetical protein JCM17039_11920 [Blautia glucerasea]
MDFGGTLSNLMHGYREPMQADFVRECVTPLDTTRQLQLVIDPHESEVKSLAYEVRSSDGRKVIENRKINALEEAEGYLRTPIEISSGLLMNQEYSMQITLDTDTGEAYYYTRVVSRSATKVSEYVAFAKEFARKCMDKTMADELSVYLEVAETGVRNFNDVSISSSLSDISWGNLLPQMSREGIPVIKDINETTASIQLEYEITANNDEGKAEYYNVTDFFRMRYTESRIMLLDFQRSASQVFDPQLSVISDRGLLLGVGDKEVSYMTNEEAEVVAFVREGELWTYVPESGKFVDVFSFRKQENSDFRDASTEHGIKLLSVEKDGDVNFMVYGYMSRGNHEGYSGVGVYHYSNDQNMVEEKVFIPSTESYEFLNDDLGILSYVNKENQLFLVLAKDLYQININESSYEILAEGINSDNFVVSDTNAHAAWIVSQGENAGQIELMDFDSQKTRMIAPAESQELRTLGFMNEDLIYGILQNGDIITDENGHSREGLTSFRIEDFKGNLKKEYHQDGFYIIDVTVGRTLMEFQLAAKTEKGYSVQKKDNIMNNGNTTAKLVSVEQTSSDRQGTMTRLTFEDSPESDKPLILHAKMRSVKEHVVKLQVETPEEELYYVYGKGGLDSTWTNPAAAVKRADALTGVVLNRAQQYVWERGNVKTQITLNTEDIPDIIKSGSWDKKVLQEGMGDQGTIIDLTGCSLENILYEISAQRAVIVKTGENSSRVIVGYDEYNTWLLDPATGEVKPYGLNDSTALFQKAGNVFITYLEAVKY